MAAATHNGVAGPELCAPSPRDLHKCSIANKLCLTVVVLGASGDLAKKKTFPALFTLFKRGCAPHAQQQWSCHRFKADWAWGSDVLCFSRCRARQWVANRRSH
jgi:hypothetical protein